MSAVAPFCGPKTAVAPFGPVNGLSTSQAIDVSGLDSRLRNVKLEVACDVDNPLTGPKGATAVFGPQKGATADMLDVLDQNVSLVHVTGNFQFDIPQSGIKPANIY